MDEKIINNIGSNKKPIIIIAIAAVILLVVVALAIGVYFYWSNLKKQKVKNVLENTGNTAEKITEDATKGVLPSLQTNPLENKPDLNPADNANPLKNIKINPFE